MALVKNFRYCVKCHALFFNGEGDKGSCPSDGGTHRAEGFNFELTFGGPETATEQAFWQQCGRCQVAFFDGYPDKGRCNLGGAHSPKRRQSFVVPHDIEGTRYKQKAWEYCVKCKAMFYDGYPEKGNCAAGGPHERHPDAYRFVLPHDTPAGFGDDVELIPADD